MYYASNLFFNASNIFLKNNVMSYAYNTFFANNISAISIALGVFTYLLVISNIVMLLIYIVKTIKITMKIIKNDNVKVKNEK